MDRKKLIDALSLIAWNSEPKNAQTITEAILLLNEQEEIVRCKDCKHSHTLANEDVLWCNYERHKPDWFCADGKRKDSN